MLGKYDYIKYPFSRFHSIQRTPYHCKVIQHLINKAYKRMKRFVAGSGVGLVVGAAIVYLFFLNPQAFQIKLKWTPSGYHIVGGGIGEVDIKGSLKKASLPLDQFSLPFYSNNIDCPLNAANPGITPCLAPSNQSFLTLEFKGGQFTLFVAPTLASLQSPG